MAASELARRCRAAAKQAVRQRRWHLSEVLETVTLGHRSVVAPQDFWPSHRFFIVPPSTPGGQAADAATAQTEQHRWQPVNWHDMVPRSSKTSSAATAMALKLEVLETVTLGHRSVVAPQDVWLSHRLFIVPPSTRGGQAAHAATAQTEQHRWQPVNWHDGAAQQQNKQCGNGYGT